MLQKNKGLAPFTPLTKGGVVIVLWIIIAAIVLGGGYAAYRYHNYQQPTTGNLQQKTETSVDTNNWKTYRNEKYEFEFKYPSSWYLHDRDTFKGNFVVLLKTEDFPNIESESYALEHQITVGVNNMKGAYDKKLTQEEYIQDISSDNDYTGKPTSIKWVKINKFNMFRVEHKNENMFHTLSYYYFNDGKVFNFYLYPFSDSDMNSLSDFEDFEKMVTTFKFTK